ncbi:hypothetical protein AC579_10008 [Pseudocercospora musae]|uniref:Uncharacterized protein n=1 Tax=Pseudocercospora musae TaxID=113226 RepID=A0A139I9A6_9PEZI|nr:hypothetical protein AC579_10008 [Pseudocercospora musae]
MVGPAGDLVDTMLTESSVWYGSEAQRCGTVLPRDSSIVANAQQFCLKWRMNAKAGTYTQRRRAVQHYQEHKHAWGAWR